MLLLRPTLWLMVATAIAVSRNDMLYPFGADRGDQLWPNPGGHENLELPLNIPLPFLGGMPQRLFLSNHGAVSFDRMTPSCGLWNFPMIAVFLAPTSTGTIFYRVTTNQTILARAEGDVCRLHECGGRAFSWGFVATWVGVGDNVVQGSTFQLVMVTNGRQSFAMLHYGRIAWTQLSGYTADIGFVGTNGVHFVNGSLVPNASRLTGNSNMGSAGRWIYRVDGEEVLGSTPCDDRKYLRRPLRASPAFVSMFENAPIRFSGTCANDSSQIRITFVDQMKGPIVADATYAGNNSFIAKSPHFFSLGRVRVNISVDSSRYFAFLFVVSPEVSPSLTVKVKPGARNGETKIDISWDRSSFEDDAKVDVWVNYLHFERLVWLRAAKLAEDVNNTGDATVTVGHHLLPPEAAGNLTSISVESVVKNRTKRSIIDSAQGKYDKATAARLTKLVMFDYDDAQRRAECIAWGQRTRRVDNLPPCPLTESQARSDSCFIEDSDFILRGYFHPGASSCFRANAPGSDSGQQCCYAPDKANPARRVLLIGPPGGGSADLFSPDRNFLAHWINDVLPWSLCCRSGNPALCRDVYYAKRPSDSGIRYFGNACRVARASGDPHVVTFDLHRYTFNGYGEYWMVRSSDVFLQARMQPLGSDQVATVFSAFVCGSPGSPRLQIQLSTANQIDSLIDDVMQDDLTNPLFSNVRLGSALLSVNMQELNIRISFSAGLVLSVGFTGDALSLVTSASQGLRTVGLLGNNDQDPSNDLAAPNGQHVDVNSGLETIHFQFGETWRVSESDSMFAYVEGENHSTFNHPSFRPRFEPPDVSHISEEARRMCAGNEECLFDFAVTGSLAFANETKQTSTDFEARVDAVSKFFATCPDLTIPGNGFRVVSHFMANGTMSFGCLDGFALSQGRQVVLRCEESGVWSGGKIPTCNDLGEVRLTLTVCLVVIALLVGLTVVGLGLYCYRETRPLAERMVFYKAAK